MGKAARLSQKAATRIWLVVIDFIGLITAYEEAAIHHFLGWHTISYWAAKYHLLGFIILLGFISLVGWWWHHYHQHIPW